MKAYRVVRPWFGVQAGDVVETDSLHPALASHVEPMAPRKTPQEGGKSGGGAPNEGGTGGKEGLEVATPTAPSKPKWSPPAQKKE